MGSPIYLICFVTTKNTKVRKGPAILRGGTSAFKISRLLPQWLLAV
jgi:hypothetical protein